MSEASDRLARSRIAILEHVARRQRRHDPREEDSSGYSEGAAYTASSYPQDEEDLRDPPRRGEGWMDHAQHALRTWWRHHPAHMAVELAAPLMHDYARRKPVQLLGISLVAGAALTLARPWRLISITTLVVAVLKSSQLSSLVLAALSAADYRKDNDRPG
jgi:hypothetical protein